MNGRTLLIQPPKSSPHLYTVQFKDAPVLLCKLQSKAEAKQLMDKIWSAADALLVQFEGNVDNLCRFSKMDQGGVQGGQGCEFVYDCAFGGGGYKGPIPLAFDCAFDMFAKTWVNKDDKRKRADFVLREFSTPKELFIRDADLTDKKYWDELKPFPWYDWDKDLVEFKRDYYRNPVWYAWGPGIYKCSGQAQVHDDQTNDLTTKSFCRHW